jgi:hypothetical protein
MARSLKSGVVMCLREATPQERGFKEKGKGKKEKVKYTHGTGNIAERSN